VLECEIVDQAQLQAVLGWLHDDGLELLSVEAVTGEPSTAPVRPPGDQPAGRE
jgi:hypothetical protein